MVVAEGRNGKNGKLEGKGRVQITGVMSSFYKQWLHLFHFPHSWEVGRPSGGCGVSVLNNYRQLIRRLFCIIDGFLFLNRAKSGCTVTRRTFSRSHLTIRQDASSYHTLMWQDAFFKITGLRFLGTAPSTIRSGTGRPVCQFGDLGTAPTTEHYTLGDWSTSLPVWRPGDCTDHRALYARGLVDQSVSLETWGLHRLPSTICSGTGRSAHNLKIRGLYRPPSVIRSRTGRLVYMMANEHDMLGDWIILIF